MNRTLVSSSNLHSIGYDESTQILEIEFNNGSVYQYYDVSLETYEDLMNAASHGKFFQANIKDVYAYQKIS